jgi:molybdopterin/thiamine biosynthesis adenylyltransferase/rhodanese-related sulfurtransferase/molybdopterin converting factor small subunit
MLLMITILIPTPLRAFTKNQGEITADGNTVRGLLEDATHRYEGLRPQILDASGEVRRFVNIFLNNKDIRALTGLNTPVADGDIIEILPAVAGGADRAPAGTTTFPEWKAQLKKEIPEVRASDVATARERNPNMILIDVRTDEEWAQGHVPGAIHLDRGYLELTVESRVPDKSKPIVCYCAGGVRSLFAAKALKTLGYTRVESLIGGFDGWKRAALPFVQPVTLTEPQRRRYLRHLSIPEVGEEGQAKLLSAKLLCIGAGGLGCPSSIYLAAAGVGTLGIVDDDVVDESNLQRQILHTTDRVGTHKTASARIAIEALNPDVKVIEHQTRLTSENVLEIFSQYDLIVDGSDNFPTRYLVNDACVKLQKPCVHGSIYRFEGQLTVFWPGRGPCYRCLYPEPPPPELAPSCAEAGVLGILPGVIGILEAVEAVKIILGRGDPLVGRLIRYDALKTEFRELSIGADPKCAYCAPGVTFPGLIDYERFCGTR